MAAQILYLHWRTARLGLVPFVVAAFGLPLLTLHGAGRPEGITDGFYTTFLLQSTIPWLPFFPAVAAATGLALALSAWNWDHQGGHVYALSLPISRARYALLKFGGGALLALLPAAALLIGALLAASMVSLPAGLEFYPVAVTLRFLLSVLLVYAVCFALAAGTIRTTVIVLTTLLAVVVAGNVLMDVAATIAGRPDLAQVDVTRWIYDGLTVWPGPFHILAGNWSLIDV